MILLDTHALIWMDGDSYKANLLTADQRLLAWNSSLKRHDAGQ